MENEAVLIEHSKYFDDLEFRTILQNQNSKLSILGLNCQSINAKFDKLKMFIDYVNDQCPISVICIQESWGHEGIDMSYFSLPNYKMIIQTRRLSAHGGLITYIHDDFAYKELNSELPITSTSTLFESLFLEVWQKRFAKQKYIIGNVYRLPSYISDDVISFTIQYSDLLNIIRARSKFVYVCGDYNIDLLKINSNNEYCSFYENVLSSSFAPKITLPTRICDTTSTLIDNVYTNVIDKEHICGILVRPISDHQMYFCMMKENYLKPVTKQKYVEIEVCNQESLENFRKEIADAKIYEKLQKDLSADPNANYKILSHLLEIAKKLHIPKKTKKFNKRKHRKEVWMTNDLLTKVVKKNELYVKWKKTPLTSANYELNKKSFKDHEKEVVKDIINAKRLYYTRIFNVYRSDMKKTWKTINETLSKNKQILELPSSFFHNGKVLTNPSEIASEFNQHFANIGKTLASEIASNTTNNSDYTQYLKTPSLKTCTFKCVTQEDIVKAIDNLENKNSSGHDGISNKVLKYIKLELSNSLTLIVNQMLTTGIFPDSFKKSKITPIFKKGDSSLFVNYRPISLLPTISKIFERIIHNQMYEHLNNNNLLAAQQYGFRKLHSTEYATVKLIDHVSKRMESGNIPCTLYIDLSKAFDTLSFDILIHKLKYYGFSGTELKLLTSYLTNRTQYVKYKNYESDVIEISTGVPQGSILGPLLFSISINDIILSSNKLHFLMYADDTTIYFNLEDFDQNCTETEINNELENVNIWLKHNKLSLNAQKTKLMVFHRKQKKFNEIHLSIDTMPIEQVPTFNFLGITLDETLSWKNHTKIVANKISRVIGILFRLKNIFPKEILLTLYNTLIYSYINYGLLVWGIESSRIEALQKKAIRLVTNSAYIAHTTPLFIEEGLLKVQDIFKLKLLKFYYKLYNNLLPPYFEGYLDVINREPPRALRQHFIHQPMIKRSYAECTPLFQLIKLINAMRRDPTDTILEIIAQNNQSYCQLSYNIKKIYLDAYDPICRIRNCFVCKL